MWSIKVYLILLEAITVVVIVVFVDVNVEIVVGVLTRSVRTHLHIRH